MRKKIKEKRIHFKMELVNILIDKYTYFHLFALILHVFNTFYVEMWITQSKKLTVKPSIYLDVKKTKRKENYVKSKFLPTHWSMKSMEDMP